MNCFTKLQHALVTSVTVISFFYLVDLTFLKYYSAAEDARGGGAEGRRARYRAEVLTETAEAKENNEPMVRLESVDGAVREILASRREGDAHQDSNLMFYQYKLGLEMDYWSNKVLVGLMMEQLKRLNLAEVDQSDPELVRIVRQFWIHPPSIQTYDLQNPSLKDTSLGQSGVVDSLLKGMKGGFYVECGAFDGETRSTTLFLERERSWEGLLIEAGPGNYRHLLNKHRKAYMTPACLGIDPFPQALLFHKGREKGRLLDTREAFDWVSEQHMRLSVSEVQCFPLVTFLTALNRTHVDYLSLDTQGTEFAILETIPFNQITISVISVQYSFVPEGRKAVIDFMADKGYRVAADLSQHEGMPSDLMFVTAPL